MILSPEEYSSTSTYDLLRAAARLQVGFDRRLLRAILDRGEGILPDILRFFKEEQEDDGIEMDEDLLAIVRHLRTPAALPFLLEYARKYGFDMPEALTEAFVELGPASLEPLLDLYRESDKASDIAFTLAALRIHDPRVLELLVEELELSPFEGAMNLGIYGDAATKPALEAALARTDDKTVLRDIAEAIEEIDSPSATPPQPYDLLSDLPESSEPSFMDLDRSELLEFLNSPVPEYRAQAVRTLGLTELMPESVPRVFDLARTDPAVHVRSEAWQALEWAAEQQEIQSAMRARVRDVSAPAEERAATAVALAREFGREEPLHGIIRELDAIPEVRARAIRAMWHSLDRRFAEYIPKHLDDPDPEVRREAVTAVGWLGMVSQIGRIQKLFDDEDARESALYAYALAAPGEVSPAHVRRLFRKIEELADGLSYDESKLVRDALDSRLQIHGQEPIFLETWDEDDEDEEEDEEDAAPEEPQASPAAKVGRNDPCPCGSGKKYKKCCGQ